MQESRIFIFVLDRGFVVVGEATVSKELAFHWHLSRSQTIRIWGTTEGLAELKDGPIADKTKLDMVCERYVPFRSIIDIIVPSDKGIRAWTKSLSIKD